MLIQYTHYPTGHKNKNFHTLFPQKNQKTIIISKGY